MNVVKGPWIERTTEGPKVLNAENADCEHFKLIRKVLKWKILSRLHVSSRSGKSWTWPVKEFWTRKKTGWVHFKSIWKVLNTELKADRASSKRVKKKATFPPWKNGNKGERSEVFGKEKGRAAPTEDTKKMATKVNTPKMELQTRSTNIKVLFLVIFSNQKWRIYPQLKWYVIAFWKRKRPRYFKERLTGLTEHVLSQYGRSWTWSELWKVEGLGCGKYWLSALHVSNRYGRLKSLECGKYWLSLFFCRRIPYPNLQKYAC